VAVASWHEQISAEELRQTTEDPSGGVPQAADLAITAPRARTRSAHRAWHPTVEHQGSQSPQGL